MKQNSYGSSQKVRNAATQKVNEEILAELLEQPGVKELVQKMTPAELELFKRLVVSQGIYSRYLRERKT